MDKKFRIKHNLLYKTCSCLLIVLHLFTFGPIKDAIAFNASSSSYKLSSGALTQGGRDRSNNYTKLLLHCDGQDGSRVFTDSSTYKQTVTAKGSAKISTTQSKFGGSSAAFNGTSDYLSLADSNDWNFGTGDLTIDFWAYWNNLSSNCNFVGQHVDNTHYWSLLYSAGSYGLTFYCANTLASEIMFSLLPIYWSPSINTWYHIAVVRTSGTWYMFIDGKRYSPAQYYPDGNIPDFASKLYIGAGIWNESPISFFNGNIDELRITKGIARWKSDFTPPVSSEVDGIGFFKVWQDVTGESSLGKIQSSSFVLNPGFIPTIQTNPPVLAQDIPYQTWAINTAKTNVFDLDDYFSSADGYALTYSVTGNSKINVAIDPSTHIVSFSPPQDWSGVEKLYFTAKDTADSTCQSNEVVLQVANATGQPNKPVIVNTQLSPATIKKGDLVTLTVKAYDLDNNDLTFSYSDFFTETNHWKDGDYWYSQATWQTPSNLSGHYTVRVTVSDGALTDTKPVIVNIGSFNHPPVLDPIPDITANEGDLVVITPHATDVDNDPITYYYSAPFDTQGKWLTTYGDAGPYNIQVTASDGIDTVPGDALVTINKTNRAPQVTLTLGKYTVRPNDQISIVVSATDPDGDPMTYSIKKDGVEIGHGNFTNPYNSTTSFTDIGNHTISATLTDSLGLSTAEYKGVDVEANADRNAINPVMGDFNGDALTDLGLHNSDDGTWKVCVSDQGEFRDAVTWRSGFGTSKEWWPIGGDFDGNSKTDIGIYNNTTGELKVALASGSSFGEPSSWLTFSNASYSWQPFTGNFNGDKYTDFAVYNKDTGEVRVALGSKSGFNSGFATWLNNSDRDCIAMAGDYNGDSLNDLCLFKKSSGEFKVFFSNTLEFVDGTNWLSGYANDKDALISDFNNDGLTDIGYWDKDSGNWYYAISTGTSFVDKGTWLSGFGSSSDQSATTGDFDGNGLTDAACFNRDQVGIDRWTTRLSTNKPADLLTEIDNGIGGKTQINYTYAASYENPDLPFPVYVAKSTALINNISQWSSEERYSQVFDYSGGYFDAAEREFRGFKKATVTDPITGNYSQTYFYQGKPGEDGALKGQIEKILSFDKDNQQISQIINTYEVKKSGPTDRLLGFPALIKQTSQVWEENRTTLSTASETTYDNIGNALTQKTLGDLTKEGDEKLTETTYTQAYESGFNRPISTSLKDNDGNVVTKKTFEYYPTAGNLKTDTIYILNPLTGEHTTSQTNYEYDPLGFGNLTKSTNALNHSVTTTYETDFYTFPKTITNDLSHTITYEYNTDFGVVTSVTDANNATSSTDYDSIGRPTQVTNAYEQVVTTYTYPDFNTKTTTNTAGQFKTEYIDGLGRKYKSISIGEDGSSARDVSAEVYFNERGLTDKESMPHYADDDQISYVKYEYDIRGRVKRTMSDFYPESSFDAPADNDAIGIVEYVDTLTTQTTDPQGHKKRTIKDIYGNIAEVIEYVTGGDPEAKSDGGFHTYYEYDLQNNLVKTTDNKGNITQIIYDSIGRKLRMIDPDMGTWNYEYDLLGNLKKQTDAKQQVLEFEYDALNRLTSKLANSQTIVSYIYDDQNKDNCIGRLSKVVDQSGETEFFFDKLGREIKSIKRVDSSEYVVVREYDNLDRLSKLTYPDGEEVNYSYDANSGLLEKVYSPNSGLQTPDYVNDITYTAKGQIKAIQYGNNTQTDYTYGNDFRLSHILTRNNSGTNLQDLSYAFDLNGNVIELIDNLKNNTRSYVYDSLDRLKDANNVPAVGGGYTNYSYQYNSIGNITYKSDIGTMTYGANAGPHALTSAGGYSYQYDSNGNMTVNKNKTLTYDIENRLIQVNEGGIINLFTYDGDGGRVRKDVTTSQGHNVTTYIGSLFEIENLSDGTQKTIKHIFAGANRVASVSLRGSEAAEAIYYHSDHLGSSNVISDQNGDEIERCEYTPYGSIAQITGSDVVKHKFTGKELDSTGLYFFGARYYDPEIGRFITADTIVQAPYDSQSLNRYSYCRNNPINYVDPTGHFFWGIIIAIVKAIIAYASAHPFVVLGAAALNVAFNAHNIHNFGDFMAYAAIGAVSAAVGGAIVGPGANPVLGKVLSGAFAGGFIAGAANAGYQGAGFGGAMLSGLTTGGIAAVTAGVLYGAEKVWKSTTSSPQQAGAIRAETAGEKTPVGKGVQGKPNQALATDLKDKVVEKQAAATKFHINVKSRGASLEPGHAWITLENSKGAKSYGFWPDGVNISDGFMDNKIMPTATKTFLIGDAEYTKVMSFIDNFVAADPDWSAGSLNCVDFVGGAAKAAGISTPGFKSTIGGFTFSDPDQLASWLEK